MSGKLGWLPVQIPSGPPIGLTASGVPSGTSQSQCSRLTMTTSVTRALSCHLRIGRVRSATKNRTPDPSHRRALRASLTPIAPTVSAIGLVGFRTLRQNGLFAEEDHEPN